MDRFITFDIENPDQGVRDASGAWTGKYCAYVKDKHSGK